MVPQRHDNKPVNSPRYLVWRHAQRLIQARALAAAGKSPPPMITTAHEQPLYSQVPGLCAGKQDIEVNHEIKVTETSPEKKTTPAERSFKVLAPRFVLRPDCVSS